METLNKSKWPAVSRLIFKFICIYVVLFALPGQMLYQDLIIWFGHQVLGVVSEVSTDMTGSGDRLYHWFTFWFHLSVAFLGTLIWTAIDRNRKSYPRMGEGFYIFVRYFLAVILLMYGFGKVIPLQFSEPNLIRLTQEYGDSSPMGLAWTFMGFSTSYQMFAGFMEVLGASLLLFRRTVLAGALVLTAVLTNVFFINMFFDVPVKLNSAHYLLISLGLVSLHLKPLWDFLIMDRPAQKNVRPFLVMDSGWRTICYTIKGIFIGGVVITQLFFLYNQYNAMPEAPQSAGIYEVEEFWLNGSPLTSPDADEIRWRRLVIDNRATGLIAIDYLTGDRVSFRTDLSLPDDSLSAMIPPNPRLESSERAALKAEWQQLSNENFILRGKLGSDSIYVSLNKINHEELLLISRGFNWVNEFPFNR